MAEGMPKMPEGGGESETHERAGRARKIINAAVAGSIAAGAMGGALKESHAATSPVDHDKKIEAEKAQQPGAIDIAATLKQAEAGEPVYFDADSFGPKSDEVQVAATEWVVAFPEIGEGVLSNKDQRVIERTIDNLSDLHGHQTVQLETETIHNGGYDYLGTLAEAISELQKEKLLPEEGSFVTRNTVENYITGANEEVGEKLAAVKEYVLEYMAANQPEYTDWYVSPGDPLEERLQGTEDIAVDEVDPKDKWLESFSAPIPGEDAPMNEKIQFAEKLQDAGGGSPELNAKINGFLERANETTETGEILAKTHWTKLVDHIERVQAQR